jgi:DNA-binding NarL/FixJ family response regulator
MAMTKIVLAEDHALVREGLKLLLGAEPGMEVVAETGDGLEVEALVGRHQPQLLLLDLGMPGCHGIDVARRVRGGWPQVRIPVLTGNLQPHSVREALAAGADGYVLKQEDSRELLLALKLVLQGRQYVSRALAAAFEQPPAAAPVTARETEIIRMIARGLSNEAIAEALSRSLFTVRKHRQNLMEKLGLRNAAEITAYAIKHGLYEPA